MKEMIALILEVEDQGWYNGHDLSLNGIFIGHRKYDGASRKSVADEASLGAPFAGNLVKLAEEK